MSTEGEALIQIRAASRARFGPRATLVDIGGLKLVNESPGELADESALPLDVYSLARMVESEEGSGTAETLLCLAECARNRARAGGLSVTRLLTRSNTAYRDGRYGEQRLAWASTRLDPTERSVVAAMSALGAPETNLARGATDFFDPKTQDGGMQLGKPLRLTSKQYILDRAREGLAWVGEVANVDPYRLMMFAPSTSPDTTGALAVLDAKGSPGSYGGSGGDMATMLAIVGAGLAALYLAGS